MKVDFAQLQFDGFIRLPSLIDAPLLAEFEETMVILGDALLARKGLSQRSADAMADVLKTGGEYRARLFSNLKNLYIVHQMCQSVTRGLEAGGFFEHVDLKAPLLYPTLRADVPGEQTYLLPMHQDYATQCRRAWRLWVPLRDANAETGTMSVVPGSHSRGVLEHDVSDPLLPHVPESEFGGVAPVTATMAAGDGLLFDPLTVHSSVPARIDRMKYVLLVQIQDLATIADPDDPDDPLPDRLAMAADRDHARATAIASSSTGVT